MRHLSLALVLITLILQSCEFANKVSPSKEISNYNIEIDGVTKIKASGIYEVKVIQGQEESVRITVNSNLKEYLDIYQDGNTIKLEIDNLSTTSNAVILATITVIDLEKIDFTGLVSGEIENFKFSNSVLELSGASKIDISNCVGNTLAIDASGVASATIEGEVDELEGDFSGSSRLDAKDLNIITSATIDASGTATVTITSKNELIADASGASSIYCYGDPQKVSKDLSGVAKVKMK